MAEGGGDGMWFQETDCKNRHIEEGMKLDRLHRVRHDLPVEPRCGTLKAGR